MSIKLVRVDHRLIHGQVDLPGQSFYKPIVS